MSNQTQGRKKADGVNKKALYLCLATVALAVVLIVFITRRERNDPIGSYDDVSSGQTVSQSASSPNGESVGGAEDGSQDTPIVLTSITSTVSPGDEASVTIQGQPHTSYSIDIHYSSGVTRSAALGDQVSDENGAVTWTWKVASDVGAGTCQVVVSGGNQHYPVDIEIE